MYFHQKHKQNQVFDWISILLQVLICIFFFIQHANSLETLGNDF